jgi:starch synthase (maltosyl-transferring)
VTGRIVIVDSRPRTPTGRYPAKAVIGQPTSVSADIFRDGHDLLAARVGLRPEGESKWRSTPMVDLGNDRWTATIEPSSLGRHEFRIEAWTDRFATWRRDILVKHDAGQDIAVELEEGVLLLERRAADVAGSDRRPLLKAADALRAHTPDTLAEALADALHPSLAALLATVPDPVDLTPSEVIPLWVDRERAMFSAWYELFPRSEGGLRATADNAVARVAAMGFDVLYLPPVSPIGTSHRKGPNNTLEAGPDDPGSPWAIGSPEGGHTAIEPGLGTVDDFDHLVQVARSHDMEIALDYALQCSPDHPWVKEHPAWFHHRPDGTIKYAENPPKKYQDIYPINFWPESADGGDDERRALWQACKDILDHWIGHGVRIFRVDNPHTKPLAFWEWVIPAVQRDHPDVLFLAEAFTRPKVMAALAEVGFTQSYTYFTWRNTKWELRNYLEEIAQGPKADFMRPNFWTNTPDILAGPLRNGGPAAFKQRLVLAATLVPSYGMYSGYELIENAPASVANEEYLFSEKYEIKHRDWDDPASLAPFVTLLNDIRHRHPAFAELRNITFHGTFNENMLAYSKRSADGSDTMLMVVNLDPLFPHDDTVVLDLAMLGMPAHRPFTAYDELTGAVYTWAGPSAYVRLDPMQAAHVFSLRQIDAALLDPSQAELLGGPADGL